MGWYEIVFARLTLCSKRINVRTFKHMSTPRSSRGRCRGKSTRENLVWSGSAKQSGGCILRDTISTSTRVFVGTGTGLLSKRNIHVSISLTSWATIAGVPSSTWPIRALHTVSLLTNRQRFLVTLYDNRSRDRLSRRRGVDYTCWSVWKLPLSAAMNFRCTRRRSSSKRKGIPGTSKKTDDGK